MAKRWGERHWRRAEIGPIGVRKKLGLTLISENTGAECVYRVPVGRTDQIETDDLYIAGRLAMTSEDTQAIERGIDRIRSLGWPCAGRTSSLLGGLPDLRCRRRPIVELGVADRGPQLHIPRTD